MQRRVEGERKGKEKASEEGKRWGECSPRYIPRDREKDTPRPCEVTRATTRLSFPTRVRNVQSGG